MNNMVWVPTYHARQPYATNRYSGPSPSHLHSDPCRVQGCRHKATDEAQQQHIAVGYTSSEAVVQAAGAAAVVVGGGSAGGGVCHLGLRAANWSLGQSHTKVHTWLRMGDRCVWGQASWALGGYCSVVPSYPFVC